MKTHDVARILMELSRIFKASPNIDINELDSYLLGNRFMLDKHQIPIGLSTLVALSRVDKQQ